MIQICSFVIAVLLISQVYNTEISDLQNNYKKEADKIKTQLNGAVANLNGTAQNVIRETTKRIQGIAKGFAQNIIDTGRTLMHNIPECISQLAKQVLALPVKLIQQLVSCVTAIINHAASIAQNAIEGIINIGRIYNQFIDQIVKCKNILCSAAVLANATSNHALNIVEMGKNAASVAPFVASLEVNITTCAATQVANVSIEGAKLSGSTFQCVVKSNK